MTLHLHRAERADTLVAALAEVLLVPPADVFSVDLVAVPTRGIERWLRQQLSHHLGGSARRQTLSPAPSPASGADIDGICAHVEMPSPRTLFADLMAQLDGVRPEDDPWRPQALQWRILQVLAAEKDQAWCAPLHHHLVAGTPAGASSSRQVAVAGRVAALLTRYAETRPQMVRDWAAGGDGDGTGGPLPPQHAWQPPLLRHLVDLIGPDPASRVQSVAAALAAEPSAVDLPDRLSVFGPTRLAGVDLELLRALATSRDVHLWLPHPSAPLWNRLHDQTPVSAPRRSADRSPAVVRNPLLRSLGRDSRELQLRLAADAGPVRDVHHASDTPAPATLLQHLQTALREDEPPPPEPIEIATDDRSLQVHSCYGRARQVEVLREIVTGLLAADPTLQPRDIVVMCPDVEAFAALVLAAFGSGPTPNAPAKTGPGADPIATQPADQRDDATGHPGQRLRVRLADRSLRQTNPVLDVVSRLLDVADGRLTSADLLDLARLPPVAARFRLADDDLERARELVLESNIRWGLTVADRARFGLGGVDDNTWHRGLDRWLHGVTITGMAPDPVLHAAPLDDIESTEIELVGRIVELVHRVAAAVRGLQGEQPLQSWAAALTSALDTLTRLDTATSWQRVQADRVLAEQVSATAGAGGALGPSIGLADVRDLLAEALRGRPTRTSFRTGDLTVCSLVPMRSVPHRVVVLLGADELDLPRTPVVDGDDVLALNPLVGERDIASEDRQQVLDAVLAATERLVVLYSGADERTGARLPAAVPVGELLDDLSRRFVGPGGQPVLDSVVRHHPLQPFDPRNFAPDAPVPSFDRAALAGARALTAPRRRQPAFFDAVLAPPVHEVIELDDLVQFFAHPVRHFARHQLGLSLRDFTDDLRTELDLTLDGLGRWSIGDRMLHARLAGRSPRHVADSALGGGGLPPLELGRSIGRSISESVETLMRAADPVLRVPAASVDIRLPLPDGRELRGTVSGVRDGVLTRVQFSSLKARNRLEDWVKLLAVQSMTGHGGSAGEPIGAAASAVLIGGSRANTVELTAPERGVARRLLIDLVGAYDAGRAEPLPLPPGTAEQYARARLRGSRDADQVIFTWYEAGDFPESADPEYGLLIGTTVAELLAVRQRSEATWPTTAHAERTWFASLARAVFDPLIGHSRGR